MTRALETCIEKYKFKKGYKSRSTLVKGDNDNIFADSHKVLNRWNTYFSQLLNIQRVSDVRQIEVHTAEPLVPDPSPFEVEICYCKVENV
jgi:hypothetical protein